MIRPQLTTPISRSIAFTGVVRSRLEPGGLRFPATLLTSVQSCGAARELPADKDDATAETELRTTA